MGYTSDRLLLLPKGLAVLKAINGENKGEYNEDLLSTEPGMLLLETFLRIILMRLDRRSGGWVHFFTNYLTTSFSPTSYNLGASLATIELLRSSSTLIKSPEHILTETDLYYDGILMAVLLRCVFGSAWDNFPLAFQRTRELPAPIYWLSSSTGL